MVLERVLGKIHQGVDELASPVAKVSPLLRGLSQTSFASHPPPTMFGMEPWRVDIRYITTKADDCSGC